jgi:glycine hydroxymethyltransferase
MDIIFSLIEKEKKRNQDSLNLIASENYPSKEVLKAQGSILTVKYAEGYPHKRYYGGCEFIDQIEELAIERAKELFHAEHANVQVHSGTQANMAVYFAVLKPNDIILCMDLACGGHLSHGSLVNFSGSLYKVYFYKVNKESKLIDFDEVKDLAKKYRPKLIVCGASSYPRKIDFACFKEIADMVGAYLLGDIAHIAGLIAAGLHDNPFPYCDFVSGTTHKTLKGPRGGFILCKAEFKDLIDRTVFPGIQGGPLMHIIAAKAICFEEAKTEWFKEYQTQVIKNAKVLAEELINLGFDVVTNGTDTHIVLVDLTSKGITGKLAEETLNKIGIIVNKNMIPYDKLSANLTSGIRLGTPAITARGMKEPQVIEIAQIIQQALNNINNQEKLNSLKERVKELTSNYPIE